MDLKNLVFGIGKILRENVDGWSTSASGTPNVYPDHPPLDELSQGSYPRASIDASARSPEEGDIEKTVVTGNQLVDITVYATSSAELNDLVGKSATAIFENHDGHDANGDPYLSDEWAFDTYGITGPIFEEESTKGFTRMLKTQEIRFDHVQVRS